MARADAVRKGQGRNCSLSCARRALPRQDPNERFWSKVAKSNGCWEWQGQITNRGYGQFVIRHGKKIYAHRYAYEMEYGPIEIGLFICHHCDNRKCVRPSHLFVGTQKDNIQDAVRKCRMANGYRNGRHLHPLSTARGERSGKAKLSDEIVREIRRLAGTMSQQKIADMFGTPQTNISLIIRRKAWAHVI